MMIERQYPGEIYLTDDQAETPQAGARLQHRQQEKTAGVAQSPDTVYYAMTNAPDANNNASRQNCSPVSDPGHTPGPGSGT